MRHGSSPRRAGGRARGGTIRNWCPRPRRSRSRRHRPAAGRGSPRRWCACRYRNRRRRSRRDPPAPRRASGEQGRRGLRLAQLSDQPVAARQFAALGQEQRGDQPSAREDRDSPGAAGGVDRLDPLASGQARLQLYRIAIPASSHRLPAGTATRVAQRHWGVRTGSPATIRKPRQRVATAASRAGVCLKPGWPDTGSTSGRGNRPVRPPLDVRSVQWIGVKISPPLRRRHAYAVEAIPCGVATRASPPSVTPSCAASSGCTSTSGSSR